MALRYNPMSGELEQFDYDPYYYDQPQEAPAATTSTGTGAQIVGLGSNLAGKVIGEKGISALGNALGIGGGSPVATPVVTGVGRVGAQAVGQALGDTAASVGASQAGIAGNSIGGGLASSGTGSSGFGLSSLGAYAGPAATLALAGFVASKLLGGTRGTKQKEERRLAALSRNGADLSKIPAYNRDADFANGGTGKDLLGRAQLYEMFGTEADPDKLAKFGDAAIKAGLVKNRMGTVDIGPKAHGWMSGFFNHRDQDRGVSPFEMEADRQKARERIGALADVAKMARANGLDLNPDYVRSFTATPYSHGSFFDGLESDGSGHMRPKQDSDLLDYYNQRLGLDAQQSQSSPLADALTAGKMPPLSDSQPQSAIDYRGTAPFSLGNLATIQSLDPGMQVDPGRIPGLALALQNGGSGRA